MEGHQSGDDTNRNLYVHKVGIGIVFSINQKRCDFIKMVRTLRRLFEEHGDLLYLFQNFRDLKTREQQATSEELADHANKVMETLDEGIRSLDNLDTFFDYLHQVGASHTRIPGFKADYFWVWTCRVFPLVNRTNGMVYLQKIETPFLTAVQTTLGDRYTENVEGIYKLTIKFIIETLVTGFEASGSSGAPAAGGGGGGGGGAACPYGGGQS